jgi:hypothetical protein
MLEFTWNIKEWYIKVQVLLIQMLWFSNWSGSLICDILMYLYQHVFCVSLFSSPGSNDCVDSYHDFVSVDW